MVKRSGATVAGQVHEESAARMESKFKGVRKRKWGRWVSEIRLPHSRQRIWLGSFGSPEKAARAFDAAVFCLRGPGAEFNFPDSPPDIAGAGSLTHPEIKAAAKRHANWGAEPALPERSGSESPAPSPSTSVSEASSVLTTESDLSLDLSFLDLLEGPDPGPSQPDFEMFPGIEECPGDYKGMQFPSAGSEELNLDDFFAEDNFLWSF